MHRPSLPTRKCSWYSFLVEAKSTPGPQCGWKDYVNKNSNDTIGNRTRDLPACSAMPQLTAPPCAPNNNNNKVNNKVNNRIKTRRDTVHTDRCGYPSGQLCHAIGNRKGTQLQECLFIERQRMWDVKCVITPVISGATEIVTKGVKKNCGIHTRKTFSRINTDGR